MNNYLFQQIKKGSEIAPFFIYSIIYIRDC